MAAVQVPCPTVDRLFEDVKRAYHFFGDIQLKQEQKEVLEILVKALEMESMFTKRLSKINHLWVTQVQN